MSDLLSNLYPWTKAFHIISMTAWMAGLFYLPRLFVYHTEKAPDGSPQAEIFAVMERKLLKFIMNPAMIMTWIFGLMLLFTPGIVSWAQDFWIYVKLLAVLVLTWLHHWLEKCRKDLQMGENTRSGRTYRLMNEVPTICLVIIVIMVVVRPI